MGVVLIRSKKVPQRKPTVWINVLQRLPGQLLDFHNFIAFLKPEKKTFSFNVWGINFQIFDPKKMRILYHDTLN